MFAFVLTLMAAPVTTNVEAGVSLVPETTIQFQNTTQKKASADCERVRKALTSSNRIAFCTPDGDVEVAAAE
jgi:hypothetical protein